jgi:hypothetical protein
MCSASLREARIDFFLAAMNVLHCFSNDAQGAFLLMVSRSTRRFILSRNSMLFGLAQPRQRFQIALQVRRHDDRPPAEFPRDDPTGFHMIVQGGTGDAGNGQNLLDRQCFH